MSGLAPSPVSRTIGSTGIGVFPCAVDGSIFGWAAGNEATIEVLDEFEAAGGTLISTADHYAGGRSEIMIGAWVRRHTHRERFVLATKVGRHPDAPGLSANSITRAVNASLDRLRTDYVDLLSFDGDHPETPLEESLTAVAELIAAGKIRFLSVSDFSGKRLLEARQIAERLDLPKVGAVLAEYSLMERERYERDVAPVVHGQGLGMLARLPLANGYLRGDFRKRDDLPSSPMFAGAVRYVGRRGNKILSALDEIAAEQGHNIGRIAIAWLLSKPNVAAAVIRVKDGPALLDLLPAVDVVLSRHQIGTLDRASR